MSAGERRPFDPLRIVGTDLPPNVLLAAKLLVLGLILHGYVGKLPEPYLPMWPVFDLVSRPDLFRRGLQLAFLGGAGCLLVGRFVRTGALICGTVFFLEPFVNRLHIYYADFFCACMLLLIAVYGPRLGPWLLRGQYAVMYFGSGLNKLLDPDWHSGLFMDNFLRGWVRSGRYELVDSLLPEGWAKLLVSWGSISIELALAVLVLVPRWRAVAIWTIVLFHASTVAFVRSDFGIFVAAILSALPVLAVWPEPGSVLVRFDERSSLARGLRSVLGRVHRDGLFRWSPLATAPIADDGRATLVRLDVGARSFAGFAAINRLLLLTPLVPLVIVTVLTCPKLDRGLARIVLETTLAAGILWFFPATEWLARRLAMPRRAPGAAPT